LEPQEPALSEANGGRFNEAQVFFESQRGNLTNPSRAKSDVVFEPQRGEITKPRFLSPKGAR
ncbi:MAG: hypothetical protein ABSG32_32115, partial [Terriglobia bacterium]